MKDREDLLLLTEDAFTETYIEYPKGATGLGNKQKPTSGSPVCFQRPNNRKQWENPLGNNEDVEEH